MEIVNFACIQIAESPSFAFSRIVKVSIMIITRISNLVKRVGVLILNSETTSSTWFRFIINNWRLTDRNLNYQHWQSTDHNINYLQNGFSVGSLLEIIIIIFTSDSKLRMRLSPFVGVVYKRWESNEVWWWTEKSFHYHDTVTIYSYKEWQFDNEMTEDNENIW